MVDFYKKLENLDDFSQTVKFWPHCLIFPDFMLQASGKFVYGKVRHKVPNLYQVT